MLELPTERDALPDDAEIEEVDCPGCGTAGYVDANRNPRYISIPKCEGCIREDFRGYVDPDTDTAIGRLDALDRIQARGLLPFRDHEGDLITAVDVRRGPPGGGSYLHKLTKIVAADCPECGHDRADKTVWNIWTFEGGEAVRCRACDHTIREVSSL